MFESTQLITKILREREADGTMGRLGLALLALSMGKVAVSQGMRVASRS